MGSAQEKTIILVLRAVFFKHLAINLTRGLVPAMLIATFGDWSCGVIGLIEITKRMAAYNACPYFGKLSDTNTNTQYTGGDERCFADNAISHY